MKGTVGSMRFFSPEIVRTGAAVKVIKGRASDVWALAVTIYNLATNKFPFNAGSISDFKDEILEREPDYSIIEDGKLRDMLQQMFIKD